MTEKLNQIENNIFIEDYDVIWTEHNAIVFLFLFSLFFGVSVPLAKNPIFSLIFLIMTFIGIIGIFLILNIEFLALTFLIIYIGAIAILFLFVIMMFNMKKLHFTKEPWAGEYPAFLATTVIVMIKFFYISTTAIHQFIYNMNYNINYITDEFDFDMFVFNEDNSFDEANNFSDNEEFDILNSNEDLNQNEEDFENNNELINQENIDDNSLFSYEELLYRIKYKNNDIFILTDFLYTDHGYVFMLIGVILLSSMLGSIVLAMLSQNKRFLNVKWLLFCSN